MKKTWIVLCALVVLGGVYLWSSAQPRDSVPNAPAMDHENKDVPHIGILQTSSHPVWTEVHQGLIAGFEAGGYIVDEDVVLDLREAHGNATVTATIVEELVSGDYQLIMTLGTQATQAVVATKTNRPVIFAAVTDPIAAGIVADKTVPGANVTGSSNGASPGDQLRLLLSIAPLVKTVGIVYNPEEVNAVSGLELVKKVAAEMGIEIVTVTVSTSAEVLGAARTIAPKVDAFYMIPDNTVIAGQVALVKVASDAKKPLIAFDRTGVAAGALAAIGVDYFQLGAQTAAMAIQVLTGADTATMAVRDLTAGDLYVSTTTAKAIGLTIPADVLKQAKKVY